MKHCAFAAVLLLAASISPSFAEEEPAGDAASLLVEVLAISALLDPPILEPEEPFAPQELPLFQPQRRKGILQSVFFSATGVQADTDQLSITELDLSATVGFPLPTPNSPLLITAAVGWEVLRNNELDLPSDLYGASISFRHLKPLGERWTLDLAVSPGTYGNTETSESLFRVQGRAMGIYQWRPDTKAILGVVYLDRDDIRALPAAGMIWTPTDYLKLDFLFPRPRIALRGYRDCCSAWWLYLGGEFGGGSWGVTRASGAGDVVTLSDLRLLAGIERESELMTLKAEAGYVFDRQLEYTSDIGSVDLGDAAMIRAVVAY